MPKQQAKLPAGIPYIMGNEIAERFSFYGMSAILTTFLVKQFFNPSGDPSLSTVANAQSSNMVHLFFSLVYFLPVLGGLLADWFLGKYKTIVYLSVVYCAGHLLLSLFPANISGFSAGLVCIALGAGGIKPCVSSNVGDQFDDSNKSLIPKAFGLFFFCINIGAFLSQICIPYVSENFGYAWAFGIPGILMGIATIIFVAGRNKFIRKPAAGIRKENFVAVNMYAIANINKRKAGETVLDVARHKYSEEMVKGVKAVWRILVFFSMVPVFYALYYQSTSEWILQAQKTDLHFLGIQWLPEQVQSANGMLVLFFIPFFTFVLFPFLERRGVKVNPLNKFGLGFIISLSAITIVYWLQTEIDKGFQPNVGWQFFAYMLLTIAEVLIYQTGLEYAYTQAPERMKSTIMAFFLLSLSIGNIILSVINGSIAGGGLFSGLTGSRYYFFFIIVMLLAIAIYFFLIKPYLKKPVK